jgi:hypothetical protein
VIGFNEGLELGEFFICEAMYGSLVKIHGALLGDQVLDVEMEGFICIGKRRKET